MHGTKREYLWLAASIPLFKVLNQSLAVLEESKAKSVKVSFNQEY